MEPKRKKWNEHFTWEIPRLENAYSIIPFVKENNPNYNSTWRQQKIGMWYHHEYMYVSCAVVQRSRGVRFPYPQIPILNLRFKTMMPRAAFLGMWCLKCRDFRNEISFLIKEAIRELIHSFCPVRTQLEEDTAIEKVLPNCWFFDLGTLGCHTYEKLISVAY